MSIMVKCPYCQYSWQTKSKAVKVSCPSCYHKVQLRALPDPVHVKAPPGLKPMRKARLGSSNRYEVRPLVAREVVGNCQCCQHPLREKPQLNVMVNEEHRYHSTCFLTKIILESNGDLAAAAHLWNIPIENLQKRALKLRALGKYPAMVLA